jgi:hypothetical protein
MNVGFIKLMRTPEMRELRDNDPKAFLLLTQIADRARRTHGLNVRGLKPREALVGDHHKCGLTRAEYRCAMARLKRYGLAGFETTNKGTIATLLNDLIYDINEESQEPSNSQRATSQQPSDSHRAATNKNGKNEKNERRERVPSSSNRSFMTFEEIDRLQAEEAWEQASREFLANAEQSE